LGGLGAAFILAEARQNPTNRCPDEDGATEGDGERGQDVLEEVQEPTLRLRKKSLARILPVPDLVGDHSKSDADDDQKEPAPRLRLRH